MSGKRSFGTYSYRPQTMDLHEDKPDTSLRRLKGPFLASLATCAGSFAIGSVLSWTSVALPNLQDKPDLGEITANQQSWIGSVVALGALISGPLTGLSIEKFGRKLTLIGINLPMILGWLLMAFSPNPTLMIVGRFFTGFAMGCLTLVIPVYITECTEERLRGAIASTFPIMWAVGILFTNLGGVIGITWFWLSIIYAVAPVVLVLSMFWVPESPVFCVRNGKDDEARASIKWLRNTNDSQVEDEYQTLCDSIQNGDGGTRSFRVSDVLKKPVLKPSLIAIGLMVFQQFSGFNAVVFYTVDIFKAAGSGMDPNVSAMIVGAVNLVAVCITSALTDKAGRRILLLISSTGITIALTALGIFFYLKEQNGGETPEGISWLPLASLLFFMVSFNSGMGPMPFLLMGEIIPAHAKGFVSSVAISVMWFLAFLITKTFEDLSNALGAYGCFWLFAAVSGVGLIFSFLFVKETKGKTLDQIQKMFS